VHFFHVRSPKPAPSRSCSSTAGRVQSSNSWTSSDLSATLARTAVTPLTPSIL
jgi:hypothetical protein